MCACMCARVCGVALGIHCCTAGEKLTVLGATPRKSPPSYTLKELIPYGFTPLALGNECPLLAQFNATLNCSAPGSRYRARAIGSAGESAGVHAAATAAGEDEGGGAFKQTDEDEGGGAFKQTDALEVAAARAANDSYVPYTGDASGVAIQTLSGRIFIGGAYCYCVSV